MNERSDILNVELPKYIFLRFFWFFDLFLNNISFGLIYRTLLFLVIIAAVAILYFFLYVYVDFI